MEDQILYTVFRRKNQKHVRIRINGNGTIRVSAPEHMSRGQIARAVETRADWIRKQRAKTRKQFDDHDPTKTMLFLGEKYDVEVREGENARNRVTLSEKRKKLLVSTVLPGKQAAEAVIAGWLRRRARQVLLPRVGYLSVRTGIPFKNLYIRNQKSRWGSSSGMGNLSLNFRIVMAPPWVQRYLIIHELCHQRNFNHSRAYWEDVETYCPDYREAEAWLKEHAILLSIFR